MTVVAIDPGAHCGVAYRRDDGKADAIMIHNDIETVLSIVKAASPSTIIVERFATGGHVSKYGFETVEIVGMMRAMAYMLDAQFVRQQPQFRIAFLEEAKKQLEGRRTQHERDALAHLLAWEYHSAQ